jgi:hypothetical protein
MCAQKVRRAKRKDTPVLRKPERVYKRAKDKVVLCKGYPASLSDAPMELQRRLNEIESRGLVRCVSRSNKPGNEYEIMIWDDYEQLRSGIDIMDDILEKLKRDNGASPEHVEGEPSHNLHTTFTSPVVKVDTSIG